MPKRTWRITAVLAAAEEWISVPAPELGDEGYLSTVRARADDSGGAASAVLYLAAGDAASVPDCKDVDYQSTDESAPTLITTSTTDPFLEDDFAEGRAPYALLPGADPMNWRLHVTGGTVAQTVDVTVTAIFKKRHNQGL